MELPEVILSLVMIFTPIIIFFRWNSKRYHQMLNKRNKEKDDRFKKDNIKHEFYLKHISGYPYVSQNPDVYFQIKHNNEIYISTFNVADIENRISYQIPVENILRIEAKTEEQLLKDITIPRILIGGIFALAKPKKTTIVKQYLYLSYMDSGIQIDCLFEGYPSADLSMLTSLVNQLRIKKNKSINEECAIN